MAENREHQLKLLRKKLQFSKTIDDYVLALDNKDTSAEDLDKLSSKIREIESEITDLTQALPDKIAQRTKPRTVKSYYTTPQTSSDSTPAPPTGPTGPTGPAPTGPTGPTGPALTASSQPAAGSGLETKQKKKPVKSKEFVDSSSDEDEDTSKPKGGKKAPPKSKIPELFGPSDEDNDKNVLEVHNNETFSEEDVRVVKVDVPDEADDDILIVEEVTVDRALIPASKIKLEPTTKGEKTKDKDEDPALSETESFDSRLSPRPRSSQSRTLTPSPSRRIRLRSSSSRSPSPNTSAPKKNKPDKDDPKLPEFKVHNDKQNWKVMALKALGKIPHSFSYAVDLSKLKKPDARVCSYYQWGTCKDFKWGSVAYHNGPKGTWHHACAWCFAATETLQPHRIIECPFIKLSYNRPRDADN